MRVLAVPHPEREHRANELLGRRGLVRTRGHHTQRYPTISLAPTAGRLPAMRPFGSRRHITADTPLDGEIPVDSKHKMSELAPAKVQSSIDRALRILAARHAAGAHRVHELQAVVQVCPAGEHYARWRKDRHRIMQRSSKRWGTHNWPDRLAANDVAVVLLPYPAGRVGPALAAAKIVCEPVFIHGRAETRPAVELLAHPGRAALAAHDARQRHARPRAACARGVPARAHATPLAAGLRRLLVAAAATRRPVTTRTPGTARRHQAL